MHPEIFDRIYLTKIRNDQAMRFLEDIPLLPNAKLCFQQETLITERGTELNKQMLNGLPYCRTIPIGRTIMIINLEQNLANAFTQLELHKLAARNVSGGRDTGARLDSVKCLQWII